MEPYILTELQMERNAYKKPPIERLVDLDRVMHCIHNIDPPDGITVDDFYQDKRIGDILKRVCEEVSQIPTFTLKECLDEVIKYGMDIGVIKKES